LNRENGFMIYRICFAVQAWLMFTAVIAWTRVNMQCASLM